MFLLQIGKNVSILTFGLFIQIITIQKSSTSDSKLIADIQKKMKKAAAELNFEAAAEYRDRLIMLKNTLRDLS